MSFSGINSSVLPEEAFRLTCDISGLDLALFDPSNTLKIANERWLRTHGLEIASAAGTPAHRCWPADDSNDRVLHINRARTTGVSIFFHEQRNGREVETAIIPLSNADVMLLSTHAAFDRSEWPSRLPMPELLGTAGEAANRVSTLSRREREVFNLLAGGMSIKQVAASLDRSEKTIEGHRDAIYRKLEVNNRAQIALVAIEAGLRPTRLTHTLEN